MVTENRTGVYAITNMRNGKTYIGSAARSIGLRWAEHRRSLRRGKHHNRHLQFAWKADGEEMFEFAVLVICLPAECVVYEQRFIDLMETANDQHGYNLAPKAGSSLGVKHTPETRAKGSAVRIGKKQTMEARLNNAAAQRKRWERQSPEDRAKHGAPRRGTHLTETTREKIAASKRGKKRGPLSAEWRKRIGDSTRGKKQPARSQAHRDKIAAANRQRVTTDEARRNMSKAHIGSKMSQEAIDKSANARRGAKRTPEQIARMSAGRIAKNKLRQLEMSSPALLQLTLPYKSL